MTIVDSIFIPLGSCCCKREREREDWWPEEVDRIYSRPHHLGTMIMMRISMMLVIIIMRTVMMIVIEIETMSMSANVSVSQYESQARTSL